MLYQNASFDSLKIIRPALGLDVVGVETLEKLYPLNYNYNRNNT